MNFCFHRPCKCQNRLKDQQWWKGGGVSLPHMTHITIWPELNSPSSRCRSDYCLWMAHAWVEEIDNGWSVGVSLTINSNSKVNCSISLPFSNFSSSLSLFLLSLPLHLLLNTPSICFILHHIAWRRKEHHDMGGGRKNIVVEEKKQAGYETNGQNDYKEMKS